MPIIINPEAFYTVGDLVEILNKSILTIRRYCREGRFTGVVKRGREYIIPGKGVIEYFTAEEKERVKKWIKKKYW